MTNRLALASLFTADAVASSFDAQCEAQALTGRTFPPLLTMLDGAYGLQIPAATAGAIKYLNMNLFGLDKRPTLAKGVGSRAAVITVTQALHAYAVALSAGVSDKAKAVPVAAMPAWADPVAIAKAKAERKDAKQAKAVDGADGADDSADADIANALTAAPIDMHAEALSAWAKFAAFLDVGAITAAERDGFADLLSKAVTKAEPAPAVDKVARKARKAQQEAEDRASTAATLQTFPSVGQLLTAPAVA